jgi:hypothetical protein
VAEIFQEQAIPISDEQEEQEQQQIFPNMDEYMCEQFADTSPLNFQPRDFNVPLFPGVASFLFQKNLLSFGN